MLRFGLPVEPADGGQLLAGLIGPLKYFFLDLAGQLPITKGLSGGRNRRRFAFFRVTVPKNPLPEDSPNLLWSFFLKNCICYLVNRPGKKEQINRHALRGGQNE